MTLPVPRELAPAPTEGEDQFGVNVVTWHISLEGFGADIRAWTIAFNAMGFGWYDGNGAPDFGLGLLGERYLDYSTGDVYRKFAGGWAWIFNMRGPAGVVDTSAVIAKAIGTAKGDLLGFSGNATPARLPLGTDGQLLTADSSQALGVKWENAPATGAQRWTALLAGTDFSTTAASTSTITMLVDHTVATGTGKICPGMSIKLSLSGVIYFCICTAITSNLMTVAGVPLTVTASALTVLSWGLIPPIPLEYTINGAFAQSATSQMLADYLLLLNKWTGPRARLVWYSHKTTTSDSGASQNCIQVLVNNNPVCTSNSNAGTPVSASSWTNTTNDINTANNVLSFGDTLELAVNASGTNKDARNLTLKALAVVE